MRSKVKFNPNQMKINDIVALTNNQHVLLSRYPLGYIFKVTEVEGNFVRVWDVKEGKILKIQFYHSRFQVILTPKT